MVYELLHHHLRSKIDIRYIIFNLFKITIFVEDTNLKCDIFFNKEKIMTLLSILKNLL